MSKTPRTDNLARGNHVVPTEWAEELERELNEARQKADTMFAAYADILDDAREQRDKAREQRDRLALSISTSFDSESSDCSDQTSNHP